MPYPWFNDLLDQDEYGEVFNSEKTFTGLARLLENHVSVAIGWTDELGSHMDILLTISPAQAGGLQRGLSAQTDLFVTIFGYGAFGFELKDDDLHPSYVGEKLNMGDNATTVKLTELIVEVRKRLL